MVEYNGATVMDYSKGAMPQTRTALESVINGPVLRLKTFRAAVANRDYAPVDILCIGDSITEGQGATVVSRRWIERLLTSLRAKWQPSSIVGARGYFPARYAFSASDQTTLAGSPTVLLNSGTYGLGQRCVSLASSGQSVSWSVSDITSFDLVYTQGSGTGTATITIDGGSSQLVNAVVSPTKNGIKFRVSGVTAGAHTITITWTSGTFYVEGIMTYNGDETKGIRLWDGGHAGATTARYATVSGASAQWFDCINAIQPSLLIYKMGTNDFGAAAASAQQAASNALATINKARTQCTVPPSVLLIIQNERADAPTGTIEPWANYVTAFKSMANSDGDMSILDLSERLGYLSPDPLAILSASDKIHPTDKGHQLIADWAFDTITR